MPIPHEVTKEFFAPMEDIPLFEENIESNSEQIANRINDLMQLFNLLDAAFGRNNNTNNNDESSNTESTESDKSSETSNEPIYESTENGNPHFNLPNFNRIREGVLHHYLENQRNSQTDNNRNNE